MDIFDCGRCPNDLGMVANVHRSMELKMRIDVKLCKLEKQLYKQCILNPGGDKILLVCF